MLLLKTSFEASNCINPPAIVDTFLTVGASFIVAYQIISKRYSKDILIGYAAIGFLALLTSYNTGTMIILISVLAIISIKDVDLDDVIRFIYSYEMLFLLINTLYAIILSVITDYSLSTVINGVVRYHFGMGHPNRFSVYLFNIIIMWIWLNYDRLHKNHLFIIAAISAINYYFTITRTNTIATAVVLLLLVFMKKIGKDKSDRIATLAKWAVPVVSVSNIGAIYLFIAGNPFVNTLNTLLSDRIRLGSYGLTFYGPTILGQAVEYGKVQWDNIWQLNYFTSDNIYSFFLFNIGLVWLVLISIGFYKLAQRKDNRINFCIIMWAIYGITEVQGTNVFLLFPLLILGCLFSNREDYISE